MIEKAPLELSADFKYALDLMEDQRDRRNLFITGRAGTGKSTLLTLFRNTTRKKAVVVAPTGIAALNVQGQTIHSFFGFPPKLINKSDIRRRRNRKLYEKMEMLIIDEISMVRADMIDNIDYFLQINRDDPRPFGGVQVVFFGDLFQLPPVVSTQVEHQLFQTTYESPYFFSAHIFKHFQIEMVELQKTYRQESRNFVRLLDAVRVNQADYDDLEDLNIRHIEDFDAEDFYITLSARNATVNSINAKQLSKLPGPEVTFSAGISGSFQPHLYPTESLLGLRLGCQVMFIKNDPERKFVNGTIGKVIKLNPDCIEVQLSDDKGNKKVIEVAKLEWEVVKYKQEPNEKGEIETEVLGTFKQYPLRLAWAITIHKSQGKTFDRVIIDLGKGAFAHGQTYVALSRCRTLEGIVLKQPLTPKDIQVDERIVEFYESGMR